MVSVPLEIDTLYGLGSRFGVVEHVATEIHRKGLRSWVV